VEVPHEILTTVLAKADTSDDLGWTVSVDSTVCRAHQHAAGATEREQEQGVGGGITHV